MKTPNRSPLPAALAAGGALFASAGLKTWLVAAGKVPFNADEAVVALMARHILQGERPVFFYGQAYMGSLDAWLVAGAFALFGQAAWVVRLVQGILYLLVLATTILLGKVALRSWWVGIAAAWLLAIPAVNVTVYTTASLGGYVEALLIGNLVLLCTLGLTRRLQNDRPRPGGRRWAAGLANARGLKNAGLWLVWGALAGLGLWAFGLTLVYTLPAGIWLLWQLACRISGVRRGGEPASRPAGRGARGPQAASAFGAALLPAGAGFLLGSAPWWGYAAAHGLAPLVRELSGRNIAGVEGLSQLDGVAQHLASLVLFGSSAALGFRPPWELRWLAVPLLPLALAFWLAVAAHLVKTFARPGGPGRAFFRAALFRAGRGAGLLLLAAVALMLGLGFALTPFGADPSGRYFLPLAVPLALFAGDYLWSLRRRAGRLAWGLLALVLVYHLAGTLEAARRNPPGLTTQFNPLTQVDLRAQAALVAFLRANGERRGYTNYWVAYPLAFASGEEFIFVPRLPYHWDFRYTPRDDRYPAYSALVEGSDRVAYITTKHPALEARLRRLFTTRGIAWQEAQVGDYHVFYDLSKPVRPDDTLFQVGLEGSTP